MSFDPYGNPTGSTETATMPLGYDGNRCDGSRTGFLVCEGGKLVYEAVK